jgi:ubiquinone biosynthesis monooxygenase Coq7
MTDRPSKTTEGRLAGDLAPKEAIERMIRVDHAGEYGAKRIYAGQLSVLGQSEHGPIIEHMAEQEEKHLQYFEKAIGDRGVRPTALLPIWHAAGFALGAATAMMGPRAAMACTVAVEEAIDEHYQAQLDTLGADEAPLKQAIAEFREEELEHRDIALEREAELAPGYEVLSHVIKRGSKLAIWLSERV